MIEVPSMLSYEVPAIAKTFDRGSLWSKNTNRDISTSLERFKSGRPIITTKTKLVKENGRYVMSKDASA